MLLGASWMCYNLWKRIGNFIPKDIWIVGFFIKAVSLFKCSIFLYISLFKCLFNVFCFKKWLFSLMILLLWCHILQITCKILMSSCKEYRITHCFIIHKDAVYLWWWALETSSWISWTFPFPSLHWTWPPSPDPPAPLQLSSSPLESSTKQRTGI